MMASKVKCYYYPVGGITETMGGFGVPMIEGKELDFQEYDLDKAKEYALSFTWERSAGLWRTLIQDPIIIEPLPDSTSEKLALPESTGDANLQESYLEVDSKSMVEVNDVVKPYVEVDSTGIVVNGEAEIIQAEPTVPHLPL
jgi:hypothetical protein